MTKVKENVVDKTQLKKRARAIMDALEQEYPEAICSLDHQDPLQLLISTRLAAQCTDARVNIVGQTLYARYRNVDDFADADLEELESIIRPCGFYHTKARDIIAACKMLRDEYDGVVPDTIEALTRLPGVGRKTANLVVGDIYGKPAVVCDTHCIRLTNLMGLTTTKDPLKCEMQLREILDLDRSNDFCHRTVLHGRAVCVARRPQCDICCVRSLCDYGQKNV